ncbi:MAG: response regulator [Arenicella sp.]|nr:response regulator [Arenicella sp.]
MPDSRLNSVVELREILNSAISLFSSDRVDESQMMAIVESSFEKLLNVSHTSGYESFSELFEFVYANWSEVDGYDAECLSSINDILVCCLNIFSNPRREVDEVGRIEMALIDYDWQIPYSETERVSVVNELAKDVSMLSDHQLNVAELFDVAEPQERKFKKAKKTKALVQEIDNDNVVIELDDGVSPEAFVIKSESESIEIGIPTLESDVNERGQKTPDSVPVSVKALFLELEQDADNLAEDLSLRVETETFTKTQNEIFSIFAEELEEICEEFESDINQMSDISSVLKNNVSIVRNMLDAAEHIEYEALTEIILIIYQTIELSGMSDDILTAQKIVTWPWVLKQFLVNGITTKSVNIVNLFIQQNVPDFTTEEVHDICLRLRELNSEAFESGAEARPRIAELQALSLTVPEDCDKSLFESFINELPDQTRELNESLGLFVEHDSRDALDVARRVAHTIKGSGNTIGVVGLANMTHHFEDILDRLAKDKVKPSPALSEVLYDVADQLEAMSEAVVEGSALPESALQSYQTILDWANAMDGDVDIANLQSVSSVEGERVEAQDKSVAAPSAELSTSVLAEDGTKKNGSQSTMRVTQAIIDDLVRVAGENMISSGRIQEHALLTKDSLQGLRKQQAQLNSIVLELEQLVFVRGVSSDHSASKGDFDPLEMEQYNELHTATQRLLESSVDSLAMIDSSIEQTVNLESVVLDQVELQKENQTQVLKMRMLPVSSVANRFARAVRQASRLTGKEVNFHIVGEDTQVDSGILQQLVDPVMHVLRNAIDHGIESIEERVAANKSEVGNVTLVFERIADQIIVRCHDDGAGFDYAKILTKAKDQNLIPESQESLSDAEASRLVLIPGFSTKDSITQVSGRGIGMDVVNQRIQEIKGNLKINSSADAGTEIIVSLPVSLMSTHALLINFEGRLIAVSNRGIEDIVYLDENSVSQVGGQATMVWNTEVLNVHSLAQVLNISLEEETTNKIAVIVRLPSGAMEAVIVPFIEDSRDLVLKSLSAYLPKVKGIVGASILGDGSVTPVIDLAELDLNKGINKIINTGSSRFGVAISADENVRKKTSCVLVVDDSFSARRSMAAFVEDLGYRVLQANDGVDAQEIIDDDTNHIILVITDLEMPRMNGIDLCRVVKSHPRLSDIPVIMVTSRSTQKHVDLAIKAGVDDYVQTVRRRCFS